LASDPHTATRLATKLYAFFVSETNPPDPAFINQLATVYLQNDTAIAPVIHTLLTSAPFQDPANFFTRYAWPAEFVARALKEVGWTGFSVGTALSPLMNMSQELFEPPNVGGWALGTGWFSSGAMLARMNLGATLAMNQKFKLATLVAPARNSPQAILDSLLTHLTPATLDATTYGDLASYAASGGPWTGSDTQLQAKAAGLTHLILSAPNYQAV
jgi:uncharacterized protein (DUF1800 family)